MSKASLRLSMLQPQLGACCMPGLHTFVVPAVPAGYSGVKQA